jgi:hypothetical protein
VRFSSNLNRIREPLSSSSFLRPEATGVVETTPGDAESCSAACGSKTDVLEELNAGD